MAAEGEEVFDVGWEVGRSVLVLDVFPEGVHVTYFQMEL